MSFITFRIPQTEIANINNDMELTVNGRKYNCIAAGRGKDGMIFHASCKEQNMTKAIATKRGLKRTLNVDAVLQGA